MRRLTTWLLLLAWAWPAAADDARSHYQRAEARQTAKQYEQAIQEYQMALRIQPKMLAAHQHLGRLLNERKRWREALPALQAALALQPGDVQNYLDLTESLYFLKRYDEGLKYLQQARVRFPRNGSVYWYWGSYMLAKGKREQALDALEKAVQLAPALKKDIREDEELAPLRHDKRFKRLLAAG